MKKLISMLAALAVVTTGTAAFATDFTVETKNAEGETVTSTMAATDAATQATYEADEDGLYTVDLASVAGTQDQTTILAVEGKTIKVGSIKYINQSATQSFTFGMDEPADTVYVLAGGSAINPTLVGSIEKEEVATGYTVSGAVTNVVSQEYIDEMSGYVVELYGEEAVADYVAAYTTTAYLISTEEIENYISYYQGETESFEFVKEAVVSAESGTYTFTDVESGEYAIIISRPSALPYMEYLTVEDENITYEAVELVMGDVETCIDWMVDSGDAIHVLRNSTDIESEDFNPAFDVSPDLMVDSTDAIGVLRNSTDIYYYDTALINDYM